MKRASRVRWDVAIKPPRMVGRVVAVVDPEDGPFALAAHTMRARAEQTGNLAPCDTVLRAWWRRGRVTKRERLTRVVLKHRGAVRVASLSVVGGDGQFARVPLIGVAK